MKVVTKSFLRYLYRRRGLTLLQFMGIACGVAAAMGMALSARTALRSFADTIELIRGRATHSIERPVGPMSEGKLVHIMRDPAVDGFAPVIDRRLRLKGGDAVRLLGIDPFLDKDIRPGIARFLLGLDEKNAGEHLLSFLTKKQSVLVDGRLAKQLGIGPGDELETQRGDLPVAGIFESPAGEPLVLMDMAHAQEWFGLQGRLDRVDLVLNDPGDFLARWEDGFLIQSGLQRRETMDNMLRAFRLNLEALSLLALFVGVFLIYNTAMFAVVSRRRDAGILRSLGAHRHEIVAAFMSEIMLLGALGGALGGLLGFGLSHFMTDLVGSTISHLYFFLNPSPPPWSFWIIPAGTLLGCGASLLGSILPMVELLRLEPVQAVSNRTAGQGSSAVTLRTGAAGVGVLVLSLILLSLASFQVYIGFAGAFVFLIGSSLLTGSVLVLVGPLIRRALYRLAGLTGKVAAGNILFNLGRTAVAVAAFMVALSMSIGLSVMIGSFRNSLTWWMGTQLSGELYIASMVDVEIPLDFYRELQEIPGVAGIDAFRNVRISFRGKPAYVSAIDAAVLQKFTDFGWVEGDDDNWEPVKKGAAVVSESFARRFKVDAGDTITLEGVHGPVELEVSGVFYDYTSEHGIVMMDRSTYYLIYEDRTIDSVGIFLDDKYPEPEEVLDRIKGMAGDRGLPVITRTQLHESILRVFDTTFAVTRSMRLLAIIVAFFGIAGAILTLFMERQREFGIYRALGFSTTQVAGMTLLEGMVMGIISFILSIIVGTAVAVILIKVINLQSFNWTIFYHPSPGPYLAAFATAFTASLGATVYPIFRVWRNYPQIQLREE